MNRRFAIGILILGTILPLFEQKAFAISESIVISAVQTGDVTSASNEFIEIYNTSTQAVDITDWCLYYMNASLSYTGKLLCFEAVDDLHHVFISPQSSLTLISSQYAAALNVTDALLFSATLAQISGHVQLVDAAGQEIDRVGWGYNAAGAESTAAESAGAGYMLQRVNSDGVYQDTDDNSQDLIVVPLVFSPVFFALIQLPDVCKNIDGFQLDIPAEFILDEQGDCAAMVVDVCSNLEGVQPVPPTGFIVTDSICAHDLPKLTLTELHPNPTGGDADHEFIELYNPNKFPVSLTGYVLVVGDDEKHRIALGDEVIQPYSYKAFYNQKYAFTLVNKSDVVKLISLDGLVIDRTQQYTNAGEGMSWALIDGGWVMTNRPTPGAANVANLVIAKPTKKPATISTLKPCAANQYRNPETNRCRLITVATPALMACADNETRNPETNRCRKISSASRELVPCKENQERNPETNRCRNKVSNEIPKAEHAVMGAVTSRSDNHYLFIALLLVVLAAMSYVVWEWRFELKKFGQRTLKFLRIRK